MRTITYTIYICILLILSAGIAYAEEVDPPVHGPLSCKYCHKVNESGSHFTHIYAERGPYMICTNCHGSDPNAFKFKDGNSFSDTTICNTCHSPGGIFDGVNDSIIGAKPNWNNRVYDNDNLKAGKEKWCAGCHDDVSAIVKGEIASNKTGDGNTYGYYVTGHGRDTSYTKMSWQDTSAIGNPGANQSCDKCHNTTSKHIVSGTNPNSHRLKSGYENNQNNDDCNNCHAPGGSAIANPQFYTNSQDYENSSHGGKNCTDCHDIHGSAGAYVSMTKGDEQNLCYQCHKDPMSGGIRNDALSNNRPGGYSSANDIQEAFSKSEKHDLGTLFTLNGKNYNLECTSCHNIHLVTGKYWDAEYGKSPITRFTNNIALWGDGIEEKMDDFAARGSGSGGWYFSIARGRNIIFDQKAVYQPPKSGDGYNFEYSGDVLPDYATFCLDCHTYRMSGANPPVNWGQGIPCTGNSVDPPDQRVECGMQHGLGAANLPKNTIDPGLLGSGGNPDPIFNVTGVTRGRGVGHFMRWPYETAQRIAGINFVMSCTDCHEAHGSNRGSMIRERFNTNENGACGTGNNGENCADAGNWNSYCNACHYYYGGDHTGKSCGSASCHEVNSLHRIIHNTASGGTSLWTEPGRPTNTPEIKNVLGTIGNNELMVTFSQGVYTNRDDTGALIPDDFVLTDANGNNPRTITNVIHTPGSSIAILVTSNPLMTNDMLNDTLATAGISIWNGSNPAGPWPVKIGMKVVIFQLNEPAGSTIATDEENVIKGIVNDPTQTFLGDGFFHGDGFNNSIIFNNYNQSMQASTTMTLETRIKPFIVDSGGVSTIQRILERLVGGNYQISVWRNTNVTEYPNYQPPSNVASIAFWVNPVDNHGGNNYKLVLTNYTYYPILANHYYNIKVVWNSNKIGGIPADIFVDDQGIDGNGAEEYWTGFANATDSNQSQLTSKYQLYEGDKIKTGDGKFAIGSNINQNGLFFNGLIDWIKWKDSVDYSLG